MFSEELQAQLKNVHTYAVTPFKEDNIFELDLDGLSRNLEFLIEKGVRAINVGGGTGEIEALTSAELEALARTALEVAGERVLVYPSLPGNLSVAMELAPRYQEMGAQVMLAMPPLIRGQVPKDLEGVFNYYHLLAQASDLPFMPYNTQGWSPEFFARLAEIDRIIAIKDPCHDPHNFFRAIKLLGDRFVWVGNKRHDPGVLQYRYQAGMEGFTTGVSNFLPQYELAMHEAALEKDWGCIITLQEQVAPLERLRLAHDDAAMVKAGMDLVGHSRADASVPRAWTSATLDGRRYGRCWRI